MKKKISHYIIFTLPIIAMILVMGMYERTKTFNFANGLYFVKVSRDWQVTTKHQGDSDLAIFRDQRATHNRNAGAIIRFHTYVKEGFDSVEEFYDNLEDRPDIKYKHIEKIYQGHIRRKSFFDIYTMNNSGKSIGVISAVMETDEHYLFLELFTNEFSININKRLFFTIMESITPIDK